MLKAGTISDSLKGGAHEMLSIAMSTSETYEERADALAAMLEIVAPEVLDLLLADDKFAAKKSKRNVVPSNGAQPYTDSPGQTRMFANDDDE